VRTWREPVVVAAVELITGSLDNLAGRQGFAERGELSEPVEAWESGRPATSERSETKWLGVRDDFRNWLIRAA